MAMGSTSDFQVVDRWPSGDMPDGPTNRRCSSAKIPMAEGPFYRRGVVMTSIDPSLANVRYIVTDVDAAIAFYTEHFGFTLRYSAAPAFADVVRGPLRLLLSGPTSSGARTQPDGAVPTAGGWNRIHLIVDDLAAEIDRLRAADVPFRSDIVSGPGGQQILVSDPSGNLVELFQPA